MKIKPTIAYLIIIACLIAALFLQRECYHCPDVIVPDTVIMAHTDTILKDTTIYKPKPIHDTLIMPIVLQPDSLDTANILKDYYHLRIYQRDLVKNKYGYVSLTDSVYMNSLLGSKLNYEFYKHDTTIYVQNPVEVKNRIKVFAVAGISENIKFGNPDINLGLMLVTKKDNAYSAQYGVFNQNIMLNSYWKIKFKR